MAHEDEDGIVISFPEVFAEVRQTHDEVKEMRTELRAITDHENRIRALEQKLWIASGAAVVVASSIGAFVSQVIPGA